ncbi:MAG: FtsX-like permease family protein [Candidatus Aenigmatarchaeota archaeon]|nr:ABC transporter permease [Candidatus Aenigmarchaeota archaeon]
MNEFVEIALKNIWRQKTRSALTIIGIMIGISAIVALGSISEGLKVIVEENLQQASGMITIIQKSDRSLFVAIATSRISETTAEEIAKVNGVKQTTNILMSSAYLDSQNTFSQPDIFFVGIEPADIDMFISSNIRYDGELLEVGDTNEAVLGETIAKKLNADLGDIVTFKDYEFVVKGILEKTGDTSTDSGIIVPIETARVVLDREDYTMVIALPEDIDDVGEVAKNIEENVDGVTAITTEQFAKQVSNIIDQISFFTVGIAAISAIVGGLGVMNTMIMSVMERRKEIGVLKAIGATRKFVIKQIIVESALLSLIGGLIGIGIGYLGSYSISYFSEGLAFAKVTVSLLINAMGFALFLGVIGGLYPAIMASNLDPIEALRYE